MKAILTNRSLALVFRLILGIVFIYASYDKLGGSQAFADAVSNYRILPHATVNAFAIILPWVHFITGICLVLGVLAPGAGLLAAGLYFMFIVAMISAIARGLDISCGCFNLEDEGERVAIQALWPRILGMLAGLQVMIASLQTDWPAAWFKRKS